jgi:glycosyltransferase involved in cell wall biosynthesis
MPTNVPQVSVLMTIYNAASFLHESIDSLIAQDFSNWELIAIENGSTDESASILAGYKDPRIRIFSFPQNIGRTPALCQAFNQALGEYIAVLDADDVAYPQRFNKQVEFLNNNLETVLVGSWVKEIDERGQEFKTWEPPVNSYELYECLGWISPIVNSSVMYRRKIALAAGGYPQQYVYAQDFALLLELVQHGKIAVIGEYLCKLRIYSGNMSRSPKHAIDVASEGLRLMEYAGKKLALSKKAQRMNRCSVAKYNIRWGLALLKNGDMLLGAKKISSALFFNPDVLWTNQLFRSPFQAV